MASRFVGIDHERVHFERTLTEPDQWTLSARGRGIELHEFRVDIGMIMLLLGGLIGSSIGLYLGVRRLIRDLTPARSS